MLKANIVMNDSSILNNVYLFKSKKLDDTIINSKKEAEKAIAAERTIFFSGQYIQGGIIPQQIASYDLFEDEEDVQKRLDDFISRNSGIWDLNDTSEFIMEYRKELLDLLK
jgi:hypothetical protein